MTMSEGRSLGGGGRGIVVQKFGGTSVGSGKRMGEVANIIKNTLHGGEDGQGAGGFPVVVLSAMSGYVKSEGTTTRLIHAAMAAVKEDSKEVNKILSLLKSAHLVAIHEALADSEEAVMLQLRVNEELDHLKGFLEAIAVIGELSAKSKDAIISTGERLCALIFAAVLRSKGIKAECVDLSSVVDKSAATLEGNELFNVVRQNICSVIVETCSWNLPNPMEEGGELPFNRVSSFKNMGDISFIDSMNRGQRNGSAVSFRSASSTSVCSTDNNSRANCTEDGEDGEDDVFDEDLGPLCMNIGGGGSSTSVSSPSRRPSVSAPTPMSSKAMCANFRKDSYVVPIVTGFFGYMNGGIMETIGRGYSDFTAALIACGFRAEELQVWKEVDGIFSSDPRKIKNAKLLERVTPGEAAELSFYGSEVIHPFTMEQVTNRKIPIRIKNTFNPDGPGTVIDPAWGSNLSGTDSVDSELSVVRQGAVAVTAKRGVLILQVKSNRQLGSRGFFAKVFSILDSHKLNVDIISTSIVDISMTLEDRKKERLGLALKELAYVGQVSVMKGMAIVSMIGERMSNQVGMSASFFAALSQKKINIEMISQGASEINISCVIAEEGVDIALEALHEILVKTLPSSSA
eukprot:Nk52_evm44s1569 gene=Nk52_evmTU44s1569